MDPPPSRQVPSHDAAAGAAGSATPAPVEDGTAAEAGGSAAAGEARSTQRLPVVQSHSSTHQVHSLKKRAYTAANTCAHNTHTAHAPNTSTRHVTGYAIMFLEARAQAHQADAPTRLGGCWVRM